MFLWFHVRFINPSKEHPRRIKKVDKRIAKELNYDGVEFPAQEKDFSKIEVKNNISINVFGYENGLVFPIYISKQKFEESMDLLLLIDDDDTLCVHQRLLIKLFVLMINLVNQLLFIEVQMQLMNFLKQFLRTISTVEK